MRFVPYRAEVGVKLRLRRHPRQVCQVQHYQDVLQADIRAIAQAPALRQRKSNRPARLFAQVRLTAGLGHHLCGSLKWLYLHSLFGKYRALM